MGLYFLRFDGYYLSKEKLPDYGGIYVVYTGIRDVKSKKIFLRKLIYVGEAKNIYERHQNDEKQEEFDAELNEGEFLIYATCKHATDRVRIQDAIIYRIKPKLNIVAKKSFNHPLTVLSISGCHKGIPNNIICPNFKLSDLLSKKDI